MIKFSIALTGYRRRLINRRMVRIKILPTMFGTCYRLFIETKRGTLFVCPDEPEVPGVLMISSLEKDAETFDSRFLAEKRAVVLNDDIQLARTYGAFFDTTGLKPDAARIYTFPPIPPEV